MVADEAAGQPEPQALVAPPDPVSIDPAEDPSAGALPEPEQALAPVHSNGHRANARAHHQAALVLPSEPGEATDPPLQVICFGGPRILYRGQEVWSSDVIDKFKHWEVLVFLAAQRTGAVSRDVLCDRIWGESGVKDVVHALNQNLYRLRLQVLEAAPDLPGQFVEVQRSGRCTLDPAVVWSDVHRFVALCEEGKALPDDRAKEAFTEARALYRGDLLARRDYTWLDERDESGLTLPELYRTMYYAATRELADLHLRDREPAAAVPLYRELLQAQPGAQGLVRALFRCYRQVGDRNALVREERHLREVLQEMAAGETDPALREPEPKTTALFQQILSEFETREAAPAAG